MLEPWWWSADRADQAPEPATNQCKHADTTQNIYTHIARSLHWYHPITCKPSFLHVSSPLFLKSRKETLFSSCPLRLCTWLSIWQQTSLKGAHLWIYPSLPFSKAWYPYLAFSCYQFMSPILFELGFGLSLGKLKYRLCKVDAQHWLFYHMLDGKDCQQITNLPDSNIGMWRLDQPRLATCCTQGLVMVCYQCWSRLFVKMNQCCLHKSKIVNERGKRIQTQMVCNIYFSGKGHTVAKSNSRST
jgi:hypothetical protein